MASAVGLEKGLYLARPVLDTGLRSGGSAEACRARNLRTDAQGDRETYQDNSISTG